jgi:hypothetical protein
MEIWLSALSLRMRQILLVAVEVFECCFCFEWLFILAL